jgi:hypothetical protein
MRASRIVTLGIVVLTVFLFWCNSVLAGPSLWPSNKGEICLYNTTNGQYARLAVSRTIGNNYIVHGFVTEGDNPNYSLFNGNAIADGDKVLIQVTSSGYRGSMDGHISNVIETYGSIGRGELNASDLTGWVLSIDFHCESPASCVFENSANEQPLEFRPLTECP